MSLVSNCFYASQLVPSWWQTFAWVWLGGYGSLPSVLDSSQPHCNETEQY